MSRLRIFGTAIVAFAHAQFVSAAYEQLRFSSSLMNFECSDDFGFGCPAPSICAYDRLIQKHYCCIPGNSDGICWTPSENCGGGSSSLPSGSQIGCSSGEDAYCCLKDREQCTQTSGQVNICWGTGADPVANISETGMNATYSSLSAASPTATFWPVEIAALEANSSPSGTPGSPTSGANPTNAPSNGLSGGAIGGIVGGIVGGAFIVGAILFLLWRRTRIASGPKLVADNFDQDSQQSTGYRDHDPNHGHEMLHYTASTQTGQSEKYAHHANFLSATAVEAPAYENNVVEMSVNHRSVPVELDASSQR